MKKTSRIMRSITGILLLLVILAVIGVGLFANNAIKTSIEVAGAKHVTRIEVPVEQSEELRGAGQCPCDTGHPHGA